jgi:transcription elongation GreA/GreB family factor
VTLKTQDGQTERHLIVDPAEAVLDTSRISADSPLARAVLGRRVGENAVIQAPSGPYPVQVIETLREHG